MSVGEGVSKWVMEGFQSDFICRMCPRAYMCATACVMMKRNDLLSMYVRECAYNKHYCTRSHCREKAPHSLTRSPTHSLAHSLTHSLTHSHKYAYARIHSFASTCTRTHALSRTKWLKHSIPHETTHHCTDLYGAWIHARTFMNAQAFGCENEISASASEWMRVYTRKAQVQINR